jgi:hypothetical protein
MLDNPAEKSDMRYLRAYQFVFISPKWFANLGISIICGIVPVVGQIVLMGYHFEMIEAMLRDGEENYPDFDVNRLMPYLIRGAWPFIIQLVASIPLALIMVTCYFVFVGVMVTSQGEPDVGVLLTFASLFFGAAAFGGVVLPLLVLPLEIRAGLTKSLQAAFNREFYFEFVKTCWKELILTQLFIFVSGTFLMGLGFLLCIIPFYFAWAWTTYARTHLIYQIYCRYLEKGGVPPAVKDEAVFR